MPLRIMPDGEPIESTDRVMALSIWAKHVGRKTNSRILEAGIGKPTFPTNAAALTFIIGFHQKKVEAALEAQQLLEMLPVIDNKLVLTAELCDEIVSKQASYDYGDPDGEEKCRSKLAQVLTNWYGTQIKPNNLIFTVGGVSAIKIALEALQEKNREGNILTPVPYYPLYAGRNGENKLFPIQVMEEPGYQLTAHAIEKALFELGRELTKNDNPLLDKHMKQIIQKKISAFLFCDPNNPLGTITKSEEWVRIIDLLNEYPETSIILDEAYAEMHHNISEPLPSFLNCLAKKFVNDHDKLENFKKRLIILRSATKGLSAAGERMAVAVIFDKHILSKFRSINIAMIGHAPSSSQHLYAELMAMFDKNKKREMASRAAFYGQQVNLVYERLYSMGANMPDLVYKPAGAFYVLADFKDLFDLPLCEDARRILTAEDKAQEIYSYPETDEDIVYNLLFKVGIMVAPGSYFGLQKEQGFVRITCSLGYSALTELLNRIEQCLIEARICKQVRLKNQIHSCLEEFSNEETYVSYARQYRHLLSSFDTDNTYISQALQLKKINQKLENLIEEIKNKLINQQPLSGQNSERIFINGVGSKDISFFKYHMPPRDVSSYHSPLIRSRL